MKTRMSVTFAALLATATLSGCASMSPRTCALVGGVTGAAVGLLASEVSHTRSTQTIHPTPDRPGDPVTTSRKGARGIPQGEGLVYGAVGGAAIGYAICD